jgi:hypothetical protein
MSKPTNSYPEPVGSKSITEQIDEHEKAIAKLKQELAKQEFREFPKYIMNPAEPTQGLTVNDAKEEAAARKSFAEDAKKAQADKELEKKIQALREAHAKGA